MTDGAINAMSRAIGDMEASIRNLNEKWGERERAASEGRSLIHSKIDSMRNDLTMLSAEVENVSNDLTEIKPAIDEFKSARDRQAGAMSFGRWMWTAMLAAAGLIGWLINEWLHLPKPH